MLTFEKQLELINNKSIRLASLVQTAIHGWHGVDSANDDCPAKAIAEALNLDPEYTYNCYHSNPYDVPDDIIEKVKEAAENGSLDDLEIHPADLAYPPLWIVEEFGKFLQK
jgi:hypothetical protein